MVWTSAPVRERRFNPTRRAVSREAKDFVAAVLVQVHAVEKRRRRRAPSAEALHRQAVEALACDLAHAYLHDPELRIMVELSKQHLSPNKRRAPFMTEAFADLVRLMASRDLGLLDLQLGCATPFGGRRSTVAAGAKLRALVDKLGLEYMDFSAPKPDRPAVELRGEKVVVRIGETIERRAARLPLPDTDEVARLLADMEQVNRWLGDADLAWTGLGRVDLRARRLRRVFNNGTFAEGGRLFDGFWQQLPSADRLAYLRIDGSPIAQLDFGQFGLRMAYAEVGADPPAGDLYSIPGFEPYRSEVKTVIQALLGADGPLKRMPANGRGRLPKRVTFRQLYAAIVSAHRPIESVFGSRAAMRHMRAESDIAIRVLLELKDRGITALPVHDALLVALPHAAVARSAMVQICRAVTGIVMPVEVESVH